jgi:translation initiation factor IF-3
VPDVRVIGDDGEQLGVMETRAAIRLAREKGLDLVEVAATADPPVCRIIDFGKFQYEAKKKANEAKKKQVVITVKEVKFRPGTDDHDYDYRMKHARAWLTDGDKVKATIWFRGREMTHRELGSRILEQLEKDLTDIAEVEARPRMEGNQMFIIFAPKRHKGASGGSSSGSGGGGGASSGGSGGGSSNSTGGGGITPKPEPRPQQPPPTPEAEQQP